MTKAELNTRLDYTLCDLLDITVDELDSVPLDIVEGLREGLRDE